MSWKGMSNADNALREIGVEWIDWNASTGDAARKSERPTTVDGTIAYLSNTINANKNNNCIVVLMHDAKGKDLTVESLPSVIGHLKKYNYNFGILK